MSIISETRKKLEENQDLNYQIFSKRTTPDANNILGVRTPVIRKLAKEVIKNNPLDYLKGWDYQYHEEFCLLGMVLAQAPLPLSQKKEFLERYVSEIHSWASCDTFVASFTFSEEEKDLILPVLLKYRFSKEEYELRFLVVMLLWHYLTSKHFDTIIEVIDGIHVDYYYTNMAIAWLISILYFEDKDFVLTYLKECHLNDFTYNKALQKITESLKASPEEKSYIRSLKRIHLHSHERRGLTNPA